MYPISAPSLIPRRACDQILRALRDTRVIFITGARQVGKSTLATELAKTSFPAQFLTLDDHATRKAAERDPTGFIASLRRPAILDEVQRVPDLLLAIKAVVDRDPTPGRFLLTGSANPLMNSKIKDALTGRLEMVTLWPLAQAEIHGTSHNVAERFFANRPPQINDAPVGRDAFVSVVAAGGYPEARLREELRRRSWFKNYIDTLVNRDLRDISDAFKLSEARQLLRVLAAQATGLVNYKTLADKLQLHPSTVKSYVELLEISFLVYRLPAWRPGLSSREVQTPKLHFVDSGLLRALLGTSIDRIGWDDQVTGKLVETFVVMETIKHLSWMDDEVRAFHYRENKDEVDLVLEDSSGGIVAVEVKATASLDPRDWRTLEKLRTRMGRRFLCGVVVYTGGNTIPLGERLWAMPISGLWDDGGT